MKKNFLLTILILVPAFFLVILGMRNPVLDHSPGPKQRPRAVIEKELTSSVASSCDVHLDAATPPPPVLSVPVAETQPPYIVPLFLDADAPAPTLLPPRAPPASFRTLS